ncbi:MAG: hypothetical protein AB8B55_08660 [Mariniblastus sp.]
MKNLCFVKSMLTICIVSLSFSSGPSTLLGQTVVRAVRMIPAQIPSNVPPEIRAQLEAQMAAQAGVATAVPTPAAAGSAEPTVDAKAERERKRAERLKKLAKLTFNRLPSKMLETWYKPDVDTNNVDLPPAPAKAFLDSDVRFDMAVTKLQKDFTMGDWDSIGQFLKMIPDANAKIVYGQILAAATGSNARKLQGAQNGGQRLDPRSLQSQYLSFNDIMSIAKIAPEKIEKAQISQFSAAFSQAIARGNTSEDLIEMFEAELKKEEPIFEKRQIAKILFGSQLPIPAGKFLPELETAKTENDHEALNLLSRHYLALYQNEEDKKKEGLEQAWHVTQAILAAKDVDKDERKTALARAVKLSNEVSDELGQKWLSDSFVAQPETGMEVLGAIGADASQSLKTYARSAEVRLERLKLQNDAVSALIKESKENTTKWKGQLELLAMNWLREAGISYSDDESTQMGPNMNRDVYGNIFYYNMGMSRSRMNSMLSPIKTTELLEIKPSDEWLSLVDPTLKPKFDSITAQLYLKVSEQDLALPYIEKLAATHPKKAEDLVDEFITVWTKNHNPNDDRRRTNSYMYMYGFESRAESIPLTRSKQQRNLQELAEMVKRLEKLVGKDVDEKRLVTAFTVCHSTAEVYKLNEIERVFGPIEKIKPETIASLATKMRSNLATMWRDARVQKDKKTKRKKKEIEKEVVDGYAVAQKLINDALKENTDEWSLVRTNAELLHDENNYRAELKNSTEFSPRRAEAMKLFQKAANMYVSKVPELEEKDYSTTAFEQWYYASLGACDLGLITKKHRADPKQAELIRATIERLPSKAAEWHMARFANLLFNRMSSVKPELKHKYLDIGFKIVGDHKQAKEAKKVHDYYKDLVNEIKFETVIDGDSRIGHNKPFGVHVHLRHTKEIERESGGFGRYLQNQNTSTTFSYNYGRPTEDYRDKFEEAIRDSYSEQFEVLSVTFQKPEVKSIPAKEDGWRITPYAYLLLKARGPEVDKIPPAKLDLDFLDTSGYAILPVESAPLPVDASEMKPRPFRNLKITQILDERQSTDGKLILEIKAESQGIVPDLEEIMTIAPDKFEVTSVDDQGVSVAQFDDEETLPTVMSERNWLVSLEAKSGLPAKPKTFDFPTADTDQLKEVVYQRYVDADLASVEGTVNLEEKYGKKSYAWMIWAAVGALVLLTLLTGLTVWLMARPKKEKPKSRLDFDNELSPFAAISLLQEIHANNGMSEGKKNELAAAIDQLEAHYFGQSETAGSPDLKSEVKKWAKHSKLAV